MELGEAVVDEAERKKVTLETLPLFYCPMIFIIFDFDMNGVCIPWCSLSPAALFGEDVECSMGGFGGRTVILNICLICKSDAEVRLVNIEQDLSNIPFNMCACSKL